ncbi:MAG: tetratricopeptide repeat protein [Anaerolineales bacterium]|nr:tetratricopeptide repeat protein [Anaerolineales bacterium]
MRNLIPPFIYEQYQRQATLGAFPAGSLFVDLSGFTAITEALMQHGSAGAEQLADTLQAVFNPLVQAVYAQQGFITHFAGDAFVALFPQAEAEATAADVCRADAVRRAVAAAVRGQQALLARPDFATPFGTFRFAVRLGVGYGDVTWQIVAAPAGDRHSYHFAGPAIAACVAAEHAARPGEILLDQSAQTVLQLPQVAALSPAGPYRLLAPGPLPAPSPGSPPLLPTSAQQPFLPEAVIRLSQPGEFRPVLTLFLNLRGQLSAGQLAQFLQQVFSLQDRYGGYLNTVAFDDKGLNLLLFWGAPTSHENDVIRALNFALDLRAADLWPFRAGITLWEMFAGFVGAARRSEYSCYGRGVNLAARQMTTAGWGEIWLDRAVAQRAEPHFVVAALGERLFKGFDQPRPVYALQGRKQAIDTFYRGQMVGRAAELAQLHQFLQPLYNGRFAGVAIVYGEAGMGKSRLVHELHRLPWPDPPPTWLLCQTDEILRQSLNPFRYALAAYFEQTPAGDEASNKERFSHKLAQLMAATPDPNLRQELHRTRSFLGGLLDLHWPDSLYAQLEPQLRFRNTLEALKNFIKAESLRRPLVLHLEDAQWLDDDSRAFLPLLVRNVAGYPFALVMTTRYQPKPPAGSPELDGLLPPETPLLALHLHSLSQSQVAALAASLLPHPLAPDLVATLSSRAGSNPFFVEQMVLYLQEQGLLYVTEGVDGRLQLAALSRPGEAGETLLPDDVRAVLVARLDRLSQPVRQVVQTAAVLGREFPVQVLLRMLRAEDNVLDKVREAEEVAIWTALTEAHYLFRHALLRDVTYQMQLLTRRRRLHRLAGEAIAQVYAGDLAAHYADLAYHADRAEQFPAAVRWYRLAGEQAAARYANAVALAHFCRALELNPPAAAERWTLLLACEQLCRLRGDRDGQAQNLAALAALATTPEQQVAVALRQSRYAQQVGDYQAATVAAQQAMALAGTAAAGGAAAAGYLQWGRVLWRQGQYELARARLRQALALTPEPLVEAEIRHSLGIVADEQGDLAAARAYHGQALAIYRQVGARPGEGLSLNNLGNVAADEGDSAGARSFYEQALRTFREIGDRPGESLALGNLGGVADDLGLYDEARAYYQQALFLFRESGNRRLEALALSNLGLLAHRRGEDEAAAALSRQALPISRSLGDRSGEAYALTHLGHGLLGLADPAGALAAYQEALAIRRELNQPHLAAELLAGLARLALGQGDLPQALAHVQEILAFTAQNTLDGTEEPFRVSLTCYQVLHAAGDAQAETLLAGSYQALQARANAIGDPALRQVFLQQVPAHRALVQAWQAHRAAVPEGRL